jgi:hypothetical protein
MVGAVDILLGAELIPDAEAIGKGAPILVDVGFESCDAPGEVIKALWQS